MSSDGICCMRFFWRRKTLKTRILVSSQAVLHANNATIGTQNKEKKYLRSKGIQKEIQDHYIATFKKRREKEGELSGRFISWTQCKNINWRVHTQITHSQSRAHHITRGEQKLANQQASDAARDQSNRVGSPPNQVHIIQKKEEEEGERTTEKGQKYKRMQKEEPVHMKIHRKTHTWCGEEERQRVNSPSKCAVLLRNKQ